MHQFQKEDNPRFSAFEITSKCGFSFFLQGISKWDYSKFITVNVNVTFANGLN